MNSVQLNLIIQSHFTFTNNPQASTQEFGNLQLPLSRALAHHNFLGFGLQLVKDGIRPNLNKEGGV